MVLRVGMLAPVAWRTPPEHYGPWERVTSLLTEGLVRRGVAVTLFATADSVTEAELDAVVPHGYEGDPLMDGRIWEGPIATAQGCASSRSESTGNGRLNGFSSTLANRSGALSAPSAMSQICYTFVTSTSSIHGRPDSARAS